MGDTGNIKQLRPESHPLTLFCLVAAELMAKGRRGLETAAPMIIDTFPAKVGGTSLLYGKFY